MSDPGAPNGHRSPFLEIDRDDWAALAPTMPAPLTPAEIEELRGLNEALDLHEVEQVYLPLSRLLNLYAEGAQRLRDETTALLRTTSSTTPFVIGVAGSVAVGKSTAARLLAELLARWEGTPSVELVTTDGFLFPNAELERRGSWTARASPSRTTAARSPASSPT